MLSDDLIARARARLAQPAFAAAAGRLRTELAEDLARPVLVPPPDRPAGYYHDYFCPKHGVQLDFDWHSPHAHRCPAGGEAHRGAVYDRAWWWFINHVHSEAGFRLALGWRLLDDRACLAQLETLLTAYAAHYPEAGWPKDDPRPRQGKVAFSALDEAVWLIPLTWAYGLARPALAGRVCREIETRLLLPAAEHIARQRWAQVHNYMCWLNAAVAAVAVLLDRADLRSLAIDGPYGFRQQIEEGVLADGTWWEGSASYHFYTVAAFLALVRSLPESADAQGSGAHQHPKLRAAFEAPLRWAYPDLSLPAINDCWYHSSLVGEVGHGIPPADAFYEIAAGWYGDRAFHYVLGANYAATTAGGAGRPRNSLEALLYGPAEVDREFSRRPVPRLLAASAGLPDLGFAVLRAGGRPGAGRRTFLLVKYGQHGGGHGHPDKLGLLLFSHGARLSPDLGTPGYGIALNDSWYRHTLSHNTVLIDGQRQPPATGRLRQFVPPGRFRVDEGRRTHGERDPLFVPSSFASERSEGAGWEQALRLSSDSTSRSPAFGIVDAEVEWPAGAPEAGAYAGVHLRRLIAVQPGYLLEVFAVSCPDARQIDWAYHNLGRLTHLAPSVPPAVEPVAEAVPRVAGHRIAPRARDLKPGDGGDGNGSNGTLDLPAPLRLQHLVPHGADLLATLATGGAGLHLWLAAPAISGDAATGQAPVAIVADAPANPAAETMALLLRRCRAQQVVFAAVFHPHGGQPALKGVTWEHLPETLICRVRTSRGTEVWRISLSEIAAP